MKQFKCKICGHTELSEGNEWGFVNDQLACPECYGLFIRTQNRLINYASKVKK